MTTPLKRQMSNKTAQMSADWTRLLIGEKYLIELRASLTKQTKKLGGISVANLGKHHVTSNDIAERVLAREAATAANQGKGKKKVE